jgi:hypothetical protein
MDLDVRLDLDGRFDAALRYVDDHWAQFDDPVGVGADIEELRRVVSAAVPQDTTRTRLTLHRLRRTAGAAGPVAVVITTVRDILGSP